MEVRRERMMSPRRRFHVEAGVVIDKNALVSLSSMRHQTFYSIVWSELNGNSRNILSTNSAIIFTTLNRQSSIIPPYRLVGPFALSHSTFATTKAFAQGQPTSHSQATAEPRNRRTILTPCLPQNSPSPTSSLSPIRPTRYLA